MLNYCKSNKYQKSLRLFGYKEIMYCTNNEPLKKNGILNQDLGSDPKQQATDNQQLSNIGVHLEVHPSIYKTLIHKYLWSRLHWHSQQKAAKFTARLQVTTVEPTKTAKNIGWTAGGERQGLPNEHFGPNLRFSRPASSAKCTFGAIFALLVSPRPPAANLWHLIIYRPILYKK